MSTNYDASQVGVPYVRCNHISVDYGPTQVPVITAQQTVAVILADGSVAELEEMTPLNFTLNLADTTPIPLVNPTNGQPMPGNMTTTVGQVMLGILAILRKQQQQQNP